MKRTSLLLAMALVACGGASRDRDSEYPDVPAWAPLVVGGFNGWWDVQPTPDSTLGVVNGTGQVIVHVTFTNEDGPVEYDTNIAPGALWASGDAPLPGFYLVRCVGNDGRIYLRYGNYDPGIGSEAFVVSNANWSIDDAT